MKDTDLRQTILDLRAAIREAVEPLIMPIVNWLQGVIDRITGKGEP